MSIRQSNGESFLLKSPNKLSKKTGVFWDFNDVKYINFSKYGDLLLLDPIKVVKPDINENIEEKIIEYPKQNIDNKNYLEDNYLDNFDQEITVKKNNYNLNKIQEEYEIEGGSPVIYKYKDSYDDLKEKKIYAQILEHENDSKIFITSKNEIIHKNNVIKCEWENCQWRIQSIIHISNNLQKIITIKE